MSNTEPNPSAAIESAKSRHAPRLYAGERPIFAQGEFVICNSGGQDRLFIVLESIIRDGVEHIIATAAPPGEKTVTELLKEDKCHAFYCADEKNRPKFNELIAKDNVRKATFELLHQNSLVADEALWEMAAGKHAMLEEASAQRSFNPDFGPGDYVVVNSGANEIFCKVYSIRVGENVTDPGESLNIITTDHSGTYDARDARLAQNADIERFAQKGDSEAMALVRKAGHILGWPRICNSALHPADPDYSLATIAKRLIIDDIKKNFVPYLTGKALLPPSRN
jgi:hypothetical protein